MEKKLRDLAKQFPNDRELAVQSRTHLDLATNRLFPNDMDLGKELRKNYGI